VSVHPVIEQHRWVLLYGGVGVLVAGRFTVFQEKISERGRGRRADEKLEEASLFFSDCVFPTLSGI